MEKLVSSPRLKFLFDAMLLWVERYKIYKMKLVHVDENVYRKNSTNVPTGSTSSSTLFAGYIMPTENFSRKFKLLVIGNFLFNERLVAGNVGICCTLCNCQHSF
jgi:hypothetical protein